MYATAICEQFLQLQELVGHYHKLFGHTEDTFGIIGKLWNSVDINCHDMELLGVAKEM